MVAPPSEKVLMIGLDAADATLIEEWAREGHLPVLRSLMEEGPWGRLGTDPAHASAWPTVFTGATAREHGIYGGFVQPRPGSYEVSRVWADQRAQPTLWEHLDRAGRTCLIFDAPFDCPIEGFKGAQIVEWGTWLPYWERTGVPRNTWKQLLDRFGSPPLEPGTIVHRQNPGELRRLRGWLLDGVALKAQGAKWLMTEQARDLCVVVFPETHVAGHYFWDLDSSQPSSASKDSPHIFLRDVYSALDQAIGHIIAGLDDQVTLFVVSGGGMGPNYSGWHLLPDILRKLGFLVVKGRSFQDGSGGTTWNQNDFLTSIRNKIPSPIRAAVSRRLPAPLRFRLQRRWSAIPLDWSRTRAYYVPNECEGYLRINLKGREPFGCVEDGAEYDRVCQQLSEHLAELINPHTGLRAVRDIIRTDKLFPGSKQSVLPDLILLWDEKAKVTTQLYSERCGLIAKLHTARDLSPYYVGNHRSPGFAVVKGPGTARGHCLEGRHIIDLAPTILTRLGVPSPAHMGGKVWDDLWPGI